MMELANIEKRFDDNPVLTGVSLSIAEGTVTALIGLSRGGKSAVPRCINLLDIATSGKIRIGEEEVASPPGTRIAWTDIRRLRNQTGMVFQDFQLFPHRTAIENVMEGLIAVRKWPQAKARERAMALLEKVGL